MKYFKYCFIILIIFLIPALSFAEILDLKTTTAIGAQDQALAGKAGFVVTADNSVGSVMDSVIKGFLSLLGLIFIILVITAGFNWMTAGGDETKVDKAKKMISRAIIGLIVIIAAYAITAFVFKALDGVVQ